MHKYKMYICSPQNVEEWKIEKIVILVLIYTLWVRVGAKLQIIKSQFTTKGLLDTGLGI